MKNFEEFTNQYKISKTIRNELIPIGKTADWIKKRDIISHENNELKGKDAIRALNYKYAKKLFDAMHRLFIEDCLSSISQERQDEITDIVLKVSLSESLDSYRKDISKIFKFIFDEQANRWIFEYKYEMPEHWQKEIIELTEKFNNTQDKKQQKYISSIIKKLQKKIANPKVDKAGIKALHSNTSAFQLLEWKVLSNEIKVTVKDLGINDSEESLPANALIKIIRSFDGFHSYFTGFNENRANVYDLEEENKNFKSTSIVHRIFEQNLFFFLANIKNWEMVKKSVSQFKEKLNDAIYNWEHQINKLESEFRIEINQFLNLENFTKILSQNGIDKFIEVVGGKAADAGDKKTKGLNELINLTRQQLGAKRNQFPPLKKLYKQILSKGQSWFIEEFKDDTELLLSIKDFHYQYFIQKNDKDLTFKQKTFAELQEVVQGALVEMDRIFIKKDKIHSISKQLTDSWHSINDWILALSNNKEVQKVKKQTSFTLQELEDYFKQEIEGLNFYQTHVKDEHKNDLSLLKFFTKQINDKFVHIDKSWNELKQSGVLDLSALDKKKYKPKHKGFQQVATIKTFLDSCNDLNYFIKDWTLKTNKDKYDDWYNFIDSILSEFNIYFLYNKVRNYIAKKPFSSEKLKITFNTPTLLKGWARNNETTNLATLLVKNKQFYLGIFYSENKNILDYDVITKDSKKKIIQKNELRNKILTNENDCFKKVNYEQIASIGKDMYTLCWDEEINRAIRKTKNISEIWGDEITRIKESKSYAENIEDKNKYFSYLIKCAKSYWGKFELSLKNASEYETISELFKDIEDQGYKITFDNIKKSYIDEKVANGELYLFKIHNKDFSKYSKGKKNLHTYYWQGIFEQENLKDLVIKLNGEAELFYRPSSIKLSETTIHKKDEEIDNKNVINGKEKSKFAYDIVKDRRYTQDKFFFHCPITLNSKADSIPGKFNDKVNRFLQNNKDVNIIGIDRGEKHLLYYSVIDQLGNIVPNGQGSFNKINGIDYLAKLKEKEVSRDEARKSWTIIENVKELKAGYLSHIIHELSLLIIKHNAIVVLEDLNIGFKRGRMKVERQVYQKFEKALIDKLNYLVFKDKENRLQAGHYLNAYQLTNKFTSFQKLGKQSGILFYTTAAYTSITDPVTGFMKNVYKKYSSRKDAVEFWNKFESINFNAVKDRFEFTYDTKKLNSKNLEADKKDDTDLQTTWTVCSCVIRSRFIKKSKSHEIFDVNNELKYLLKKYNINYQNTNLIAEFSKIDKREFHEYCIYYFNSILNLRVTDKNKESGTSEKDFILSPVEPFFDSRNRKSRQKLPENGDANGAYNIARKGICILDKINQWDGESRLDLLVRKKDWQTYCQNRDVVKKQKEKI